MISLNAYSFGYAMGLLNKNKIWYFKDFINFIKKNNLKRIEFPVDYFSKKEKKNFEFFFKILKKENIKFIVDLEDLNINSFITLKNLSKKYDFTLIRVKMSNYFGGNRHLIKNFNLTKKTFVKKLKKIVRILKDSPLKIAIENHQDLNSKELINIINKTSKKKVGINWDIGNSLATIETPEDFLLQN